MVHPARQCLAFPPWRPVRRGGDGMPSSWSSKRERSTRRSSAREEPRAKQRNGEADRGGHRERRSRAPAGLLPALSRHCGAGLFTWPPRSLRRSAASPAALRAALDLLGTASPLHACSPGAGHPSPPRLTGAPSGKARHCLAGCHHRLRRLVQPARWRGVGRPPLSPAPACTAAETAPCWPAPWSR